MIIINITDDDWYYALICYDFLILVMCYRDRFLLYIVHYN